MVDGVPAHSFAPISAPRIKSVGTKDVQAFLSQRKTYEDAISSIPGFIPVSYRSCFDGMWSRLLKSNTSVLM